MYLHRNMYVSYLSGVADKVASRLTLPHIWKQAQYKILKHCVKDLANKQSQAHLEVGGVL